VRLIIVLLTTATMTAGVDRIAAAPGIPHAAALREDAPERSVVGTLDRVDPPTAIVVKTSSGRQTFALDKGVTIRQGSRVISLPELARHKGERVKVRYRDVGGVHRAGWVVVASPAPPRRSGTLEIESRL
jgi:hypothetical protein